MGLFAAASHGRQVSLVPVACALTLGYLAAAWLCEGARLDADDPRRSAQLPFRFESLAWRHAAVPALILLVAGGVPLLAACVAAGDLRPLALLAVTVPVLVAGALVNVFRADFSPGLFQGAETPLGNTAAINIVIWYAWGPVLAVVPMTVLLSGAIRSPGTGSLARALVIGTALAAGLGGYAARRARRLRIASCAGARAIPAAAPRLSPGSGSFRRGGPGTHAIMITAPEDPPAGRHGARTGR